MNEPLLRLRCYYCDMKLVVPFEAMADRDAAHQELRKSGWLFGVERLDDGVVVFDPLCEECARGVVGNMVQKAPSVSLEAAKSLRGLGLLGSPKPEDS